MSGKVKKEIKIPSTKVPISADDLIKKAKEEVIKKEKEKEEKKPKRGRPKKKKPEFDVEKYKENPISKSINSFLIRVGNGIIGAVKKSPLNKDEALQQGDCLIGEAICYTKEYYGIELMHPIIVIIVVTGMFGWTITDKILTIKEQQRILERATVP